MDAEQVTAWKCKKCGNYYISKASANSCCSKTESKKVCEDCGVELPQKWYSSVCNSCKEKRRYNSCRKMTIEEYEKEFPDCGVIVGYDTYFSSIKDALEYYSGEDELNFPCYFYGTKKYFVGINIDNAIESALEDAYEDAEFDNLEELYNFVKEWNERNKLTVFEETNIVVDIPEDIRKQYYKDYKEKL